MPKKPKKFKKKDPFYERELAKYEKPIPSREFILQYLKEYGRPVSKKRLIDIFDLKTDDAQEALRRRLVAMLRDGQLFSNRRNYYALIDKMELTPARVIGHPDGFGFARPEDGSKDVFLSPRQMTSLFPEDKILMRVGNFGQHSRREGIVVEILERCTQQVVGRYLEEEGIGFVEPDNKQISQSILIPRKGKGKAKEGEFVVANIITQPSARRQATGEIVEILGEHMQSGLEMEVALRSFNIPFKWSEEVQHEAKKIGKKITDSDIEGRKDMRKTAFVTIDGEDAKDFDDAVCCTPKPNGGWRLLVAIADVSHYIHPDMAMDKEAKERGNSVYFPNRTVPMLPETLSNELCSLKPNVDRLSLVCDMSISTSGELKQYAFYRAVIRSKARLTYTLVAEMLAGIVPKQYLPLLQNIKQLYALYKNLQKERKTRGALEFDIPETHIVFTKDQKIKEVKPAQRNDAHRLIEECMLQANIAAATFLAKRKLPTLYRVHEGPDAEKLENLHALLKSLGLRLTGGKKPTALDYSKLLRRTESRVDARLIQTAALRSLMQAVYTPENKGHFGLSYPIYAHFTSPIRRYPDILVHRAICHAIDKKRKNFPYDKEKMTQLGEHFSMTERRADNATRDVVAWLKCEYMLDKQGQIFDGVVSGVTNFGLFIELNDIYVEGLLHITALPNDYYHFDAIKYCLLGKHSGKRYSLGDPIQVCVAKVGLDSRQIDLDLA